MLTNPKQRTIRVPPQLVINSFEELIEVPAGTLLRDSDGTALRIKSVRDPDGLFPEPRVYASVHYEDGSSSAMHDGFDFPLFVLWLPDA